jgi:hypothetical protein
MWLGGWNPKIDTKEAPVDPQMGFFLYELLLKYGLYKQHIFDIRRRITSS